MHIALGELDAPFAEVNCPIEFLLFYPRRLSAENLRVALGTISEDFWPAFATHVGDRLQRRSFVLAEHFREIDASAEDLAQPPRLPELDTKYHWLCLSVRDAPFFLTCIQYRNGTLLLAKMDHLIGDGYSFFYLMTALAAACRKLHGAPSFDMPAPRLARTVEGAYLTARSGLSRSHERRDADIEYVRVPRAELDALVDQAAQLSTQRVSIGDVLTAKILKQLIARRPEAFQNELCLTVPVDVRRVLDELGPTFFGNGVVLHRSLLSCERVRNLPEHALAAELRSLAPKLDRAAVVEHIRTLDRRMLQGFRPLIYSAERGCLVTNLLRMPWDGMDFGTGHPNLFHAITVGPNTASLFPCGTDFQLRILHARSYAQ